MRLQCEGHFLYMLARIEFGSSDLSNIKKANKVLECLCESLVICVHQL